MIHISVSPGNCRFETELVFEGDKRRKVTIHGMSRCPHVQKLLDLLEEQGELDALKEATGRYSSSSVFALADRTVKHVACPVPTAILKGIEAAGGLSLAQDVVITMEKADPEP